MPLRVLYCLGTKGVDVRFKSVFGVGEGEGEGEGERGCFVAVGEFRVMVWWIQGEMRVGEGGGGG